MKKDLEGHLQKDCPNRNHKCQYCGEKGTFATITQVHDKTCPKKILPCTNIVCSKKVQRQHIDWHVKYECEYTEVACKHESIGCDTQLMRKDIAAHEEDDKYHLHMAINAITLLQESSSIITLRQGEAMKIRITNYQSKKEAMEPRHFPSFYTSHGYHIGLRVYANGHRRGEHTHVSIYAPILTGNYDAWVKWPLCGSITFTLLNQLEDANHHSKRLMLSREDDSRVGDSWGYPNFIPHSELDYDPVRRTQYLMDDALYFRVEVDVDDYKPWLEYTTTV